MAELTIIQTSLDPEQGPARARRRPSIAAKIAAKIGAMDRTFFTVGLEVRREFAIG
jgi:hypothetical protein